MDRTGYGQNWLWTELVMVKVKKFTENIADLMASAYGIENATLLPDTAEDCCKCKVFDRLIFNLKEKIKSSLKQETTKILTLAPDSWTIQKTQIQKMHFLESGILDEPKYKRYNLVSDETINIARDFYESDAFSRLCPGKKMIVFLFMQMATKLENRND